MPVFSRPPHYSAICTCLPSPSAWKRTLGAHLSKAADARKALTNASTIANAAISVLLEALQTAETALQSLTKVRIRTEALVMKAQIGILKPHEQKRKLGELTFEAVNVRKRHEAAIEDAWKGWRAAMTHTVRAGKAQKGLKDVLKELKWMAIRYQDTGELKQVLSDVHSSIERENVEVCQDLQEILDANQHTLRSALKRMHDHQMAWEWVDEGVMKAAREARTMSN